MCILYSNMEIKNVQYTKEKKTKRINLKTTSIASKWMKENNVSPQKVFDLAIESLIVESKAS